MNKFLTILIFCFFQYFDSFSQKSSFKIYDNNGTQVSFKKLVKKSLDSDIILFGEFHNNPIIHWLQLELLINIHNKNKKMTIGAEMFETDDQITIDEYLFGYFDERKLKDEIKTWPNFETDYLPLLKFARDNKLDFIATNIPRRYANIVFRLGIDTLNYLSDNAKNFFVNLPLEVDTSMKSYSDMKSDFFHKNDNLIFAQAIKDATMAHFIIKNKKENFIFFHINGSYHSKDYEGIYYYLKKNNTKLKILSIGCEEQKDIKKLKPDHNLADFIIVTPNNMIKTY